MDARLAMVESKGSLLYLDGYLWGHAIASYSGFSARRKAPVYSKLR